MSRRRTDCTSSSADVIVIGGGVAGCAAAYFLAREGLRVHLLERTGIASQASGATAGMLAPIGESSGPGPFLSFALGSLGRFPDLMAEVQERSGVDPEYEASGGLRLARSSTEAAALRERVAELEGEGLEWLDAASHGAQIEVGVPVLGLRRDGARVVGVETAAGFRPAGRVVVCAGSFSPACLASLEAKRLLPIEPVRGQLIILDAPSRALGIILWRGSLYLVPKRDGSLVVGATEESVGFDCAVTAQGLRWLRTEATALVPALDASSFRGAFAGLRPATPDGLPLIGPVPGIAGLMAAAGHFRNGVLLAPATASLVLDWARGTSLPPEAHPFRLERFAG